MTDEIHIAQLVTRLHLFELRTNNRPTVNVKLEMFLKEIDNKPLVRNAFETLDLLTEIEEMREINQSYHELYQKRQASLNSRQTSAHNNGIQKTAESLLRNFFAQVNQVQKAYSNLEEEYASLTRELNSIIVEISKSIKTRDTLNKKRAIAKAKAALKAQPKVHILSVDGKETGSVTIAEKKKKKQVKNRNVKTGTATKETSKNKTSIDTNDKQSKDDKTIGGLLNILRLPPGDNRL